MTTRVLTAKLRTASPDPRAADRPLLSVVIPLFNEQESIPELVRRLRHAVDDDAELIFVNDGSRDRTAELLDDLAGRDPRMVIVHLSRNFGHQAAVSAGLAQAWGQAVAVIDGDLQDPPELLPRMIEEWRGGADVVYGVRRRRRAHPLKKLAYASYYRILRRAADIDLPLDAGDFALMDRAVVDAMLDLPERSRFVRGLRAFVGFRQVAMEYDRPEREWGQSKYPLSKLIRLAVDGLFDFSSLPIRLIGWLAVAIFLSGIAIGTLAVVQWSVVLAVFTVLLGLGSVIIGSLAIVGEYVRKIFVEVKGRPTYLVRSVHRHADPSRVTRAA
jgi:polyisoprenyl-phosphate glycosyltransferase